MSALNGEFWLIDGRAHVADGQNDNGGHWVHVWDHLYEELIDQVATIPILADQVDELARQRDVNGGDPTAFREWILVLSDQLHRERRISAEENDDAYCWMQRLLQWPDYKWAAFLDRDNTDLRLWAVQTLDWIRVHGTNCELWLPTKATLRNLSDGLYDAYEEDALGATFFLECRSNGRCFIDVPFAAIDTPSGLMAYRRHSVT